MLALYIILPCTTTLAESQYEIKILKLEKLRRMRQKSCISKNLLCCHEIFEGPLLHPEGYLHLESPRDKIYRDGLSIRCV